MLKSIFLLLYSAIEAEVIKCAEVYLEQCEAFLVMPIVLKELNIEDENYYILNFCKEHVKMQPKCCMIKHNNSLNKIHLKS